MRFLRLLGMAVAILTFVTAGVGADQSGNDTQERMKLAGTWRGFAVEGKGENPDRGAVKLELIVSGRTIHGIETKGEGKIDHGEGEYVLNLGAKPLHLDASKTNARGRKESWVGIYQLDGDTLRWCVAKKERPTTFETVKGQFLLILKREAPAK